MPISFLDVPHFFYFWDYLRRQSSELMVHSLSASVLPNFFYMIYTVYISILLRQTNKCTHFL
jgi:hypothetical protein